MPKSMQDHLTFNRAKSALRGRKSLVGFLTGVGLLSLDHLQVKLADHPLEPTQLLDALLRGRIVLAHLSPLHPVFPDLKERDRDFAILDAGDRVGDAWKKRWDSLRLFTPAALNGLPGVPFPLPGGYFPTKDETADYLDSSCHRSASRVAFIR
jgi:hypothetical protein